VNFTALAFSVGSFDVVLDDELALDARPRHLKLIGFGRIALHDGVGRVEEGHLGQDVICQSYKSVRSLIHNLGNDQLFVGHGEEQQPIWIRDKRPTSKTLFTMLL